VAPAEKNRDLRGTRAGAGLAAAKLTPVRAILQAISGGRNKKAGTNAGLF
jgi:hypothetical protein